MTRLTLRTKRFDPRRNLPSYLSRNSIECKFQNAFEQAYLAFPERPVVIAREFPLHLYGIADLVCYDERCVKLKLTAFEFKIAGWRSAFQQAYRYSYYADRSIVVVPPEIAKRAFEQIEIFRLASIGLWSFDAKTKTIRKLYSPKGLPKSSSARLKAESIISENLGFIKLGHANK